MIYPQDLFYRFFRRFLVVLLLVLLVFVLLSHVFQRKYINTIWQEDMRNQLRWVGGNWQPGQMQQTLALWRSVHSRARLIVLDAGGNVIGDSHSEAGMPEDINHLSRQQLPGYASEIFALPDGGRLLLAKPKISVFPQGFYLELFAAVFLLMCLAAIVLSPLVHQLSTAFRSLSALAKEVANGHFGRELHMQRYDELGVLVQSFNEMSRKLALAEQLNTQLLQNLSHELRSPLGRISALAETAVYRPAELETCVAGITQEIALLDRLVGDLLQTARMESNLDNIEWCEFSLRDWAKGLWQRMQEKAARHGATLALQFCGRDRMICADRQRLEQAMGNLLDNALQALAGRNDGRIALCFAHSEENWSVSMQDNGPGIPAMAIPHVFQRFYRIERQAMGAAGSSGVGLGLSIVKAIVDAHRGKVNIQNVEGAGVVVSMQFAINKKLDEQAEKE